MKFRFGNTELNVNRTNNIDFVGLLQILFIALKLIGVIDWSWVWVLSPIWISLLLFVLIILIFFIYKTIRY